MQEYTTIMKAGQVHAIITAEHTTQIMTSHTTVSVYCRSGEDLIDRYDFRVKKLSDAGWDAVALGQT